MAHDEVEIGQILSAQRPETELGTRKVDPLVGAQAKTVRRGMCDPQRDEIRSR
ncbi:MAG: hypothetical protein R6X33_08455 [Candidatus Brocadiia bacterium]